MKRFVPLLLLPSLFSVIIGASGGVSAADRDGWIAREDFEPVGDPSAKKGGRLRLHWREFPKSLRLVGPYSGQVHVKTIHDLVFEPLLELDAETLDFIPAIASAWKLSRDRETFWFRIDEHARWADGTPVSSRDVLATWNHLTGSSGGASLMNASFSRGIRAVEPQGERVVRVRLWEKNWRLFFAFATMAVRPASFLERKGDFHADEFYMQFSMGSGPYELLEQDIRPGRSLILRRRPEYWAAGDLRNRGRYNFDRIQWTVVPTRESALKLFLSGTLDLLATEEAADWLEAGASDPVKKGWIRRRRIYTERAAPFTCFVFNLRAPPFSDRNVRIAFQCLFDRERIRKDFYHGEVELADSYFPGRAWCEERGEPIRYDPSRAKSLLARAGYILHGKDGRYHKPDGKLLEIRLVYLDPAWDAVLGSVAADMNRAGLDVKAERLSRPALFAAAASRRFSAVFLRWETSLLPDPGATWHSEKTGGGGPNLAGLADHRLDEICERYYETEERGRHLDLLRQVDGRLRDRQPFALGWYHDHVKILYWNSLCAPATYLSRTGGPTDALQYWWFDGEKKKALKKARRAKEAIPDGEIVVDPWKRRK